MTTEKLITEREMAARLSCSERHLRRLREQGRVPYVRMGSLTRYDAERVVAALSREVAEPADGANPGLSHQEADRQG